MIDEMFIFGGFFLQNATFVLAYSLIWSALLFEKTRRKGNIMKGL